MEPIDLESHVTSEISVVVAGNQQTGKSSLIANLCHSAFSDQYKPTVGVDYDNRILDVDGRYIKLHLWDTSGQTSFLWVAKRHIRTAHAFVLVYDVTDAASFRSMRDWIGLIDRVASARDIPKLLIGTKLDLRHKQMVSCSEAKEFAIPEGYEHIEVSSKTGKNVTAAFYILALEVLRYRRLGCVRKLGFLSPAVTFPDIHVHEDPEGPVQDGPEYSHLFKILLLGQERVGKTSLRFRFCKDYYAPGYVATAGFDYSTRTVLMEGERIKLQIWDVSGDPIYDQMRKGYYRGANAFILVYDVTDKATFASVECQLKDLDMSGQSEAPKIVIGNKSDLGHKRTVDFSSAADWADGWRIPIIETSAKNAANVDSGFLKIVMALKRQLAPWNKIYQLS
ncbi:hypothetical protein LSH36_206g04082 [Paralvinella palmiformis]|uniref:Uncharacterized protein n=1 Tax=Paralvinella palmiformis TaxID=53620 RepID=A0AAD9JPA5_9ANNE|nr:hypothetical protein LSH36_206g04082 [Paralvinella palmiformis]